MSPSFDMEKAREICKGLPVGGGQTLRANLAFLSKYYPAGKMLPAALDEIERLQAAVEANHRCLDLQYALDASEARREEVAEKIIPFAASFACPECGAFIDLPDIKRLQADVKEYDISEHVSATGQGAGRLWGSRE